MARRYRFLGKFYSNIHQCGQHWWSQHLQRSHPRQGWLFSCSKTAKRCGRYVTYILMPKHQNQFTRECQLTQQHNTCHHHKDDWRYKCTNQQNSSVNVPKVSYIHDDKLKSTQFHLSNFLITMPRCLKFSGLDTCSFMPAFFAARTSSAKASAVIATMGTVLQ